MSHKNYFLIHNIVILDSMNEKHKNPPPECMSTNTLYTFSYSPRDQPEPGNALGFKTQRFKDYSDKQAKFFTTLKNCEVEVVHELSRNSRWHFHGFILITDIMKFFIYDLTKLRLEGTFEIDTINDPVKWEEYVYKQRDLMMSFCEKNGMSYVIRTKHT